MKHRERWQGVASLVGDALEHGVSAVERVHLGTARRTFAVLESIPGVAPPARLIHTIFDRSVSAVYGTVRWFTRGVVGAAEMLLASGWEVEEE